MRGFLLSLFFWVIFWVGGWIFLRTVPGGLQLLDRQLFLNLDYQFVVFISFVILTGIFVSLFFSKQLLGQLTYMHFKRERLNLFFLIVVSLLILVNFIALIFIKQKNFNLLVLGFILTTVYYFVITLFQQVINFGVLQGGIRKIVRNSTVAILLTSIFFSFSHFISVLEGFSMGETLMVVVLSFIIGLIFSFLRMKCANIVPGLLFHFSLYLLWNGPFLYLIGS